MLTSLYVKNLALIEEVGVSFGPGLNILTGETGAGKSILLGSINLALGQKFSREMMREGADTALVELIFQVEDPEVTARLAALEIEPDDGQIIFTRKIKNGRSINRINGEACTIAQFRGAASLLLDIHGQHEHQTLLRPEEQLALIDAYDRARIDPLRRQTAEAYSGFRSLVKELETYQLDEQARERELSFLAYEIREIDEAMLEEDEEEALEKQYRRMANSRRIGEALQTVYQLTGAGEGAGDLIGRALRELSSVSAFDEELADLEQALGDTESVLADFNHSVSAYLSEFSFSEEAFREIEQRLDVIRHLQSKYGNTVPEILSYRDEQARRLDTLQNFAVRKAELERALQQQEQTLAACTAALTEARKESAAGFAEAVRRELSELNFLSNAFEIRFAEAASWSGNGKDDVIWMISTNPGEPLKPLSSVASGGELSRVMLAIRTLLADRGGTGTLIFDEIDAGISGRTAQMVSEKMTRIARHHQVICITHLAQIAAMADRHYLIEKQVENGSTVTRIRTLDEGASVEELARILGGTRITEATLASAREMKELADEKKST